MMPVGPVGPVAVVRIAWIIAQRGGSGSGPGADGDRAEALLRERYALGEIDEATYRRMFDELRWP